MGLGQPEYPVDFNIYVANEIIVKFYQKPGTFIEITVGILSQVRSLSLALWTLVSLDSPLCQTGVQSSKSIK